jgi:hypothetical protein
MKKSVESKRKVTWNTKMKMKMDNAARHNSAEENDHGGRIKVMV